jgi:hypothetical protein
MESAMNRRTLMLAATLAMAAVSSGCHLHKKAMRGGSIEPLGVIGPDGTIVEGAPVVATKTAFVDRHPLLYKPRDVFHTTGHGPIIKTMAAGVVGVPTGMACEVGQIFKGCDRCLR